MGAKMTNRLTRAASIGGVGFLLMTAVPTSAQAAALVFRFRDNVQCEAGPSDAPFLPEDTPIANSTVVVTPNGDLHVTCFGQLPAEVPLPSRTYVGTATCLSDEGAVGPERVVVTTTGHIILNCHIHPA